MIFYTYLWLREDGTPYYYDSAGPVNIATGDEVPINTLVSLITSLIDYQGLTKWGAGKPDGQPDLLEVSK